MNWKKYSIIFNLLALPFAWLFIYCGWGGFEAPASFFTPEISNRGRIHTLFYDPNSVFYSGYHAANGYEFNDNKGSVDFSKFTESEWQKYFNKKVSTDEIHFFLNDISSLQSDRCLKYLKEEIKTISDSTLKHHLSKLRDRKKVIPFFTYLNYALQLEQITHNRWDYYDTMEEDTFITKNGAHLLEGLKKDMNEEKSIFIKQRYYYQIERLYYRLAFYDEGIEFWKNHQASLVNNSSYYRFMGYAAANYYKKQEYTEANYLYSVIFDRFPMMQPEAIWSFGLHEDWDLTDCLAKAKTTREKCVLWQMFGYNYDVKKAIEGLYSLNPKSDLLPVLLSRLVNIQEEQFLETSYNYSTDRSIININSEKLDPEIFRLVDTIAFANKTLTPELWHLSAAYFNIVENNFEKAKMHLDAANKKVKTDTLFTGQMHIIQLLYDIKRSTVPVEGNYSIPPDFENRLVAHFDWLKKQDKNSALRTSDLLSWCRIYLSDFYRQQNKLIESECFNALSNKQFYNIEHIDDLLQFLKKPNKTAFEQMLTGLYGYEMNDLLSLKIHLLVYDGKFLEADALQKSEPGSMDAAVFPADPFVIHIKECHDCDFEAKQILKYNEIQIIDTLALMQQMAQKDLSHASDIYFSMANCLYNITYYGNSRIFYLISMNQVSYTFYFYDSDRETTNLPIFDCRLAESYYRKALLASTDKEFQTRCLFMIAKCRQNEEYNKESTNRKSPSDADEDFVTRDTVFYQLKTNYADTKYFQQIINECGYFKSYLK